MKTLKKTSVLFFLSFVVIGFAACKKDKQNKENDVKGSYEYQNNKVDVVSADARDTGVDGSWIFLMGRSYSDALQLRFPKVGVGQIPIGKFTYNGVPYTNPAYQPASNFNGGLITSEAAPGGDEINGGTIEIKQDGANYILTIDVKTAKGTIKGSYTGGFQKF